MRRFVRPYVQALMATAENVDQAVAVRDELASVQRLMSEVPALGKMAAHPGVPMTEKERTLEVVALHLGLQPVTRRFLGSLLRRYRLARLGDIVDGITELLNRELGVAVARVASAGALSEQEQDELRRALEAKLEKRVELRLEVDAELLAGFVVQVESQRWDASLKGQLERLTHELAQQA